LQQQHIRQLGQNDDCQEAFISFKDQNNLESNPGFGAIRNTLKKTQYLMSEM